MRSFSGVAEDRMNVHKNARLTPLGREWIVSQVESGQMPEAVGLAAGVCPRTVRKWVERFRAEGLAGLQDRSSRPHRLRKPTPAETMAPPAYDGATDRQGDGCLCGHGQSRAQTPAP